MLLWTYAVPQVRFDRVSGGMVGDPNPPCPSMLFSYPQRRPALVKVLVILARIFQGYLTLDRLKSRGGTPASPTFRTHKPGSTSG